MKIKIPIKNISLVSYQAKDIEDFIELFMDFELCKYMAGGAFENEKDAIKLFEHLLILNESQNEFTHNFAIFEKDTFIGHFEINENSFTKKDELEIVYVLKKAFWGKGIMSTIVKTIQENYSKTIVARVLPNNFNSIKMLEKVGIRKQTLTKFNNEHVIKVSL